MATEFTAYNKKIIKKSQWPLQLKHKNANISVSNINLLQYPNFSHKGMFIWVFLTQNPHPIPLQKMI